MKEEKEFKCFSEKIRYLEEKYKEKVDFKVLSLEKEILKYSGKKKFGLKELKKISMWKVGRRNLGNIEKNIEENVRKITKQAFDMIEAGENEEKSIKKVIQKLCKLHGVRIPMASAVLVAHNKDRFTIMDFRVWNMLFLLCYLKKPFPKYLKSEHYCDYLKVCKNLANKLGVSLRTLDRGLWISSKNYDC